MTDSAARTRARIVHALRWLLLLLVLVLLWILLWEAATPLVIISGIAIAYGLTKLFYLPAFELSGRVNVAWLVYFLLWFLVSLCIASAQVAWAAVRPSRVRESAVVAVHLHVRSDIMLTVIAQVASLIPGSFVVEADRAHSVLFLHALDCDSAADVRGVRDKTHEIELLTTAAFGSAHDLQVLNDWRIENGQRPVLPRAALHAQAAHVRKPRSAAGPGSTSAAGHTAARGSSAGRGTAHGEDTRHRGRR